MILYLEKRGCDFFNGDFSVKNSDVGNYRVGSYNYSIRAKNGRTYILEFTRWDKWRMRYTNKRTGKELKHPIKEIVLYNALHIDTQFEDENGCWCDLKLEKELDAKDYKYTLEDILKAVNDISLDTYTEIQFV